MTRNSKLRKARQLGVDAFLAGKTRVPARDGKVLALLEGEPVGGDCLPILKRWLAGWDRANLTSEENHKHVFKDCTLVSDKFNEYICDCGERLRGKGKHLRGNG